MASKVAEKEDPARIGHVKDAVQLRFYETSLCYDCTFSASVPNEDEESCAKKFRCHRFVLAAASEVFEKMLFGNFKEANQGQDDEIKIEVSPTVFDLAMRFIYGSVKNFQSCELAVQICYFAEKWLIAGLLRAAAEFLFEQQGPDDALLVFKMCIDLHVNGSETALWKRCCTIIEEKTFEVLSSKHWLAAGRDTIINFFNTARFTVSEAHLLDKLVLWGKARCSSDQSTDLRAEIDPMLKHIRFRSMSCQEFSAISEECDVLTTEEKLKILESLCLSDANLMPPQFSLKGYPRNLGNSEICNWGSPEQVYRPHVHGMESTRFSFNVNKAGIFLEGLYMMSVDDARSFRRDMLFTCSIHKGDSGVKLGTAKPDGVRKVVGTQWWIAFDEPVSLAKDFLYYIEIKYNSKQTGRSVLSSWTDDLKFHAVEGFCTIFFHPATKVRDVYGFKLCKSRC